MRLFEGKNLELFLNERVTNLRNEIACIDDRTILQSDEVEFSSKVVQRYHIEPLWLDTENYFGEEDSVKKQVSIPDYGRRITKLVQQPVMIIRIPFKGDKVLFECSPNNGLLFWENEARIEGNELCIDLEHSTTDANHFKKYVQDRIGQIVSHIPTVERQVASYNKSLETVAKEAVKKRREDAIKKNKFLNELGFPIRRKGDVPPTFAISVLKKPKPLDNLKVQGTSNEVTLEPSLHEVIYNEILKDIQLIGQQIERTASSFADLGEEDLRNLFLLILAANYEGGATGETFNKSGKTDILIRYKGKNLFIAECKFWSGEKGLLETIDQILKYLTWRDSKTSIILFVKNKGFTEVIEKIERIVQSHQCYIGMRGSKEEGTRQDFTFHLSDDNNRLVYIAIQAFHVVDSLE